MDATPGYRIVVAEPFDPDAVARLEAVGCVHVLKDSSPQAILAAVIDADALLIRNKAHVTARIIDAAPRLKVIGRAAPTLDHIDLRAARRRNIYVVYSPRVTVSSSAEFTLAMILCLRRRLLRFDRQIREDKFEELRKPAGHVLARDTVAFLGLDPVAEELGRMLAAAFAPRLIYHDPARMTPAEFQGTPVDLDTLLAEADVLSIHLPLTAETRGILSAERIARLRPSALVVNTSRGGLIDTTALAEALKYHLVAGAGLDVFEIEPLPKEHPIRGAPNCILTPHVSAATLDAATGRFNVTEDVIRVLSGEAPRFAADLAIP